MTRGPLKGATWLKTLKKDPKSIYTHIKHILLYAPTCNMAYHCICLFFCQIWRRLEVSPFIIVFTSCLVSPLVGAFSKKRHMYAPTCNICPWVNICATTHKLCISPPHSSGRTFPYTLKVPILQKISNHSNEGSLLLIYLRNRN